MAKSAAQRQAEYRQRARTTGDTRCLSVWIGAEAFEALDRLSRSQWGGKTQTIERLILAAQAAKTGALRALSEGEHDEAN